MGKPVINYIGNKYNYGKVFDRMGLIPKKIDKYVEPFSGGLGFLCYLSGIRDIGDIVVNDKDVMLINFYLNFKKHPEEFEKLFNIKIDKNIFEKYKKCLSNFKPTLECAIAYFIIKNCSYNSSLSVNKNGTIRSYISEYWANNFRRSTKLKEFEFFLSMIKNVRISCKDYKKLMPKNSFVFLDPPYMVYKVSDYYAEHSMNLDDIYNYFIKLDDNDNKILLTINYDKNIHDKFKKFNTYVYYKNSTHTRVSQVLKELIITNY